MVCLSFLNSITFYSTDEDLIFGVRFIIVVLPSAFAITGISMIIFGYLKFVRKGMLDWSQMILGALSNFISPCVVQHQSTGMIAYFSGFIIIQLATILSVFLALLQEKISIWNSSIGHKGTQGFFNCISRSLYQENIICP